MSSLAAALNDARPAIPLSEARLLLRHVLGCTHAWLEAHRDDALDAAQAARFTALVTRRGGGEPIAYLMGRREFYGRDFIVTPDVLIPRPETELLVELGKQALAGLPAPRILDLGTGSGCVAISLALELPAAAVTAVDVSERALAVARDNATQLGARLRLLHSDWFTALNADEGFDLIVANPPYIAAGDAHLDQGDLRFEPAGALASGSDGLAAIRRILADAPQHLTPGGRLLFEHGYDQADAVTDLLRMNYARIEQHRDLAGIVRVSGGEP